LLEISILAAKVSEIDRPLSECEKIFNFPHEYFSPFPWSLWLNQWLIMPRHWTCLKKARTILFMFMILLRILIDIETFISDEKSLHSSYSMNRTYTSLKSKASSNIAKSKIQNVFMTIRGLICSLEMACQPFERGLI
jgi:hypothetical protein